MGIANRQLVEDASILINEVDVPVEWVPTPFISGFEIIKRPEGYNIAGVIAGSIKAYLNDIEVEGFAESNADLCEQKAISEALERFSLNYFTRKHKISETSNGWASHPQPELAIENSIFELIERDVALTTWQDNGIFYEVPQTLWPDEVIQWKKTRSNKIEFLDLRIFLSRTSNGCCISALLFNENNNFVAAHASRKDLKQAILSATTECMRAARIKA